MLRGKVGRIDYVCFAVVTRPHTTIDANSRLFVVPRHIDAYDRRVEQIPNKPPERHCAKKGVLPVLRSEESRGST